MLLPATNKRAERTLKSSCADALSCTWLFLHWCLLLRQKKKKTLSGYYQRSERGHAYITQPSTGLMPAPRCRRGGNRHRGVERVEAGRLYPWKMHQAAESRPCWPVNCGGVCEQRTDRCSTHCGTEEQENVLPVLFAKLSGHWFPGTCSHFPEVKEFPWRAGIEIFCCTIFSLPGGHPAPLRDKCKRQTMSPVLLCFYLPIWPVTLLFNVTSILSLSFTPLSRTWPPSLLLTSPPYFALLSSA